jgi:uncharacterized membrane protein YdjX (TVP38/TMEM64 family)
VLGCILFLPATILTLGSGVMFGVFHGFLLSSISATLGATASFLIARFLARNRVGGWMERNPKFKAIDDAVAQEGWKIVFLTRLSPIFPFNFLNYSFGISQVRLIDYVWASWLGMLPSTLALVFVGWLIGDIALLAGDYRERSNVEWGLYGFGVLATIFFTIYVTRVARNALSERLRSNQRNDAASHPGESPSKT